MSEAQGYVDAWLAREPAMEIARGFAPPAQRASFELWGALLHQLDEAAFELSDANVARTKLAWWGEELAGIATGAVRHPLAKALAQDASARRIRPADWRALALAAIGAGGRDGAPADVEALLAQGARYAAATAHVEGMFWTHAERFDPDAPPQQPHPVAPAIAVHHALRRLEDALARDPARFPWPMNLRARHQAGPEDMADFRTSAKARATIADLANELRTRLEAACGATLLRRAQGALDAHRLRALAAGRFEKQRATGLRVLWTLWRAARRP